MTHLIVFCIFPLFLNETLLTLFCSKEDFFLGFCKYFDSGNYTGSADSTLLIYRCPGWTLAQHTAPGPRKLTAGRPKSCLILEPHAPQETVSFMMTTQIYLPVYMWWACPLQDSLLGSPKYIISIRYLEVIHDSSCRKCNIPTTVHFHHH